MIECIRRKKCKFSVYSLNYLIVLYMRMKKCHKICMKISKKNKREEKEQRQEVDERLLSPQRFFAGSFTHS
jgi:hypothetical protein